MSHEDLCLDKSSGTSTESVLTVTQVEAGAKATAGAEDPAITKAEGYPLDTATESKSQSRTESKQQSEEKAPSTPTSTSSTSPGQEPSSSTSRPGSRSSAAPDATGATLVSVSPRQEASDPSDVPKTDPMRQGPEEEEKMPKEGRQNSAEGKHT